MARRHLLTPVAIAIAVAFGLGIVLLSFSVLPRNLALMSCVLGRTMLAIAAIDARRFMIPDVLSLPAIPAGLLASGSLLDPSNCCIGGLLGARLIAINSPRRWWDKADLGSQRFLGIADQRLRCLAKGSVERSARHLVHIDFLLAEVLLLPALGQRVRPHTTLRRHGKPVERAKAPQNGSCHQNIVQPHARRACVRWCRFMMSAVGLPATSAAALSTPTKRLASPTRIGRVYSGGIFGPCP